MSPRTTQAPQKKPRSASASAEKKAAAKKAVVKKTVGKTGAGSKVSAKAKAKAPRAPGAAAKNAAAASAVILSDDLSDMLKDLLGNLLWDLLKEGWHQAAPLLADLVNVLPLTQFATMTGKPAPRGARGKAVVVAQYDVWFDAVLAALTQLRQRAEELDYIAREFDAELEDIVARAAQLLVDAAGQDHVMDVEQLMQELRSYFHYIDLDRKLPSKGSARKGRGKI